MLFYTLDEKPEYYERFINICFKEWEVYLKKRNINSVVELDAYYKTLVMTTYILIEYDELIGFYSLIQLKNSKVMIANVWMHPTERKKNKGTLIKHALMKIGNKKACLYCEKKMIPYYSNYGFKIVRYDKSYQIYHMENNYLDKMIIFYLIICVIIIGIITWFIL